MADYDLDIYQGATFSLSLTLKDSDNVPIDLTNYNVSGYLKDRYSNAGRLADLNAAKQVPYTSGVITLSISSTGTSVLPITLSFYDVEIGHITSGTVSKVLRGKATIYPEITY
jgi:hypothetical protein